MTSEYNIVREIDVLAAEIYRDKQELHLTYTQLSKLHDLPPSEIYSLYAKAKSIITSGDTSWLDGLSQRAKTQIINAGYTEFDSLKHDVTNEILDLQSLPRVGQKVALEIRRWCLKPRKYLYERRIKDRRTTTSLG